MELWRSELYHYGIKGQHWGIRRGPPYPIGSEARKRDRAQDSKSKKTGFSLSNKQKMAIWAGATAVGIAALAITASNPDFEGLISDGKECVRNALRHMGVKQLDNVSSFRFKVRTEPRTVETIEADIKKVNPKKNDSNCVACSAVCELRARGYDVVAKPHEAFSGFSLRDMKHLYKNFKVEHVHESDSSDAYESLSKRLLEFGDGARGCIGGTYKDEVIEYCISKNPNDKNLWKGIGHAFSWEVLNGKVLLYDGQDGTIESDNPWLIGLFRPDNLGFARLDNLEIRPDFISVLAENRV